MKDVNSNIQDQLDKQAADIKNLQAQINSPLIDYDRAAVVAKASGSTLANEAKNGKLKSVRIGGLVYFRQIDLKAWMSNNKKS